MGDATLPTGEQLQAVIVAALDQGDIKAVDSALTVMAVVDPHRCERVMETMRLGLAIAAPPSTGTQGPDGGGA